MNIAELFKKNFIFIPIVISIVVGGFTSIKYVLNLTTTINDNQQSLINMERDVGVLKESLSEAKSRLASAEATWNMAENLYNVLANEVREHGYDINIQPKPVKGDWNGSGMHTNFSTDEMRHDADVELFVDICDKFSNRHAEHIAVYGKDNDQRLTGLHETHDIHTFSYGEGDRGASIRIPIETVDNNYKSGYLEDRRPAGNANPYDITKVIIDTIYGN